jgi:hypothetical protein
MAQTRVPMTFQLPFQTSRCRSKQPQQWLPRTSVNASLEQMTSGKTYFCLLKTRRKRSWKPRRVLPSALCSTSRDPDEGAGTPGRCFPVQSCRAGLCLLPRNSGAGAWRASNCQLWGGRTVHAVGRGQLPCQRIDPLFRMTSPGLLSQLPALPTPEQVHCVSIADLRSCFTWPGIKQTWA